MKNWGVILIAVGALAAAIALFLMSSTVSTEEMTRLPYTGSVIGSGRYTATYNLPRAQLRELIFHGGGMLFLGGCILLVGGMLEERLRHTVGARPIEPSQDSVPTTVRTEEKGSTFPAPAYQAPDPAEAERNRKIIAGLLIAVVIVLIVLGAIGSTRSRGTVTSDINSPAGTENASRAAEQAIESALNTADNAAAAAAAVVTADNMEMPEAEIGRSDFQGE